jgi:hypothetical protein
VLQLQSELAASQTSEAEVREQLVAVEIFQLAMVNH